RSVAVTAVDLHLGWHPQGNGKWYYGLSIENGRVKDDGSLRLRSGLRAIVERFQPAIRLTPSQDILLCDLAASAKSEIDRILAEHGVARPDQLSQIQTHSMACPAIPTCGLAISEAERALPGIIDELESELRRLDLAGEKLSIRMTGCPNGCARPYQSDIGIVGRSGDKFMLFVGGHILGDRLNFTLKDLVPRAEIVPTLAALFTHFKSDRWPGESFGDFCHRLGADAVRALLPSADETTPLADADGGDAGRRTPPQTGPKRQDGPDGAEAVGVLVGERVHGAVERTHTNGDAPRAVFLGAAPALTEPRTESIAVALAEPQVAAVEPKTTSQRNETQWTGPHGEELRDFSVCFDNDGQICETAVYF